MSVESQHVTIDEALVSVGEFGRGQLRQYLLVSLAWLPAAIQTLVTVFLAQDPVAQHWWRCVDPEDEACAAVFAAAQPDICSLPQEAWMWTKRRRSIISDFNLICRDDWQPQAVNSCYFLGFLIGAGLFGTMSDQLGRRKALFTACLASLVVGVANALAPDYWWYIAFRFCTGLANSGISITAFTLATEPVGPNWRGICGICQGCFFTAGACLTALLAWGVRPWRPLLGLAALSQLPFLLLWPTISESPRWLLVAGRKGEATAALAAIAVGNRTKLPEQPLIDMGSSTAAPPSLWDVCKHSKLRVRLGIMVFIWFVVSMTYYGVSFGVGALSGSIYLNHLFVYAAEVPAYLLSGLLIESTGRRTSLVYSLTECGAAMLACAFTRGWLQRGFAMASKFGVAFAYNLAFIYTSELFPTTIRNTALGFCSQLGHMGAVLAPAVVFLGSLTNTKMVPFLVFGSGAVLAAVLATALPETLGSPTLETLSLIPSKPAIDVRMAAQPPPRKFSWAGVRHAWRAQSGWARLPGPHGDDD